MLSDCCGEEEEAAAVKPFQPLGETSKLGHCLSFPQRANAPAEGRNQENQYVRRKKARGDESGNTGQDGNRKPPDLIASNSLSRAGSEISTTKLGEENYEETQVLPAGIDPAVLKAYEPMDDDIIECQTRIHPLAAKELETVDEDHPCTKKPLFLPEDYKYPKSISSHFSFYNAGIAKVYRGVDMIETKEDRATFCIYGEDCTVTCPILENNTEDRWAWLLAVFDGHGLAAPEAVAIASRVLVQKTLEESKEVLKALEARDGDMIKRIEYRKFNTMEESVISQEHIGGGTTCSTVQMVRLGKKHYMVVSNVGDSPVLMVNNKDGRTSMISGQHAWDNKEERGKYIERCKRKGLTPREVCYGRINAGGMVMEDLEGRVRGGKPLHMYHPGTADLDIKTRDHLCNLVQRRYRVSIGGSQSIRRYTIQQRRRRKLLPSDKSEASQRSPWFLFGGAGGSNTLSSAQSTQNSTTANALSNMGPTEWSSWENVGVIPEYGHLNWGPTVLVNGEGKIQVSRSLGDREEKTVSYIWAEPDVAVYEFPPDDLDVTIIICSDGAADLWWFHQMGEVAARYFNPPPPSPSDYDLPKYPLKPKSAEGLTRRLFDITMSKGQKTSGYGEMKGRPVWDDLSIVVAHLILKDGELSADVSQPQKQEEAVVLPPPPPPSSAAAAAEVKATING